MKKGENAVFTIPPDLACGESGSTVPSHNGEDICKDGGILKKLLKEGEEIVNLNDCDKVLVNYKAQLQDGTVVSKSEGLEFTLKDGYFCPALARAAKTMKKAEKVLLTVRPQYGFGEKGRPVVGEEGAVPPNATLLINLELISPKSKEKGGDKEMFQKVLKNGDGYEHPNEGAVGKVDVIDDLDRAVLKRKKHEFALDTIPREYTFSSTGLKQDIADKESWDLSNEEKNEAAVIKKEGGDAPLKIVKYARPSNSSEKVAKNIEYNISVSEDEKKLSPGDNIGTNNASKRQKYALASQGTGQNTTGRIATITSLPVDVLKIILSYLHCNDAAKAATLCVPFAAAWRSHPRFFFKLGSKPEADLLSSVTSILSKHEGGLSSLFIMGCSEPLDEGLIEDWFQSIRDKHSMHFSLNLSLDTNWILPPIMFTFKRLSELTLRCCTITTGGEVLFPLLKVLRLRSCMFPEQNENQLQLFPSGCSSCEVVEIRSTCLPDALACTNIVLQFPFLQSLSIDMPSNTQDWSVTAPQLTWSCIKTSRAVTSGFLQQFQHLSGLAIEAYSLPEAMSFTFQNLVWLSLDILCEGNIATRLFHLLEHTPKLEKLVLEENIDHGALREPPELCLELEDCDFPSQLQSVVLKGYRGSEQENDLISFMLENLNLKAFTVILHKSLNVCSYILGPQDDHLYFDPLDGLRNLQRWYSKVKFNVSM